MQSSDPIGEKIKWRGRHPRNTLEVGPQPEYEVDHDSEECTIQSDRADCLASGPVNALTIQWSIVTSRIYGGVHAGLTATSY